MKVFISWSGDRSKYVAEALRDWLPRVIQSVKPWLSSTDIDKGARWATDIAKQLEDSSFGIICLTPENLDSRWLNFEAGALSKVLSSARVCPYLLGLDGTDVSGPLAQFQASRATRDETLKLVQTINSAFDLHPLTPAQLAETFDMWWDKLQEQLGNVPAAKEQRPKRDQGDLVKETLSIVRSMAKAQRQLIARLERPDEWFVPPVPLARFRSGKDLAAALFEEHSTPTMPPCPSCGLTFQLPAEHFEQMEMDCPECGVNLIFLRTEEGIEVHKVD